MPFKPSPDTAKFIVSQIVAKLRLVNEFDGNCNTDVPLFVVVGSGDERCPERTGTRKTPATWLTPVP